jgi:hypothetical protein
MTQEPEPASTQPEHVWKDPGVAAVRAEVCQVQSTRQETVLLFGTRQPPQAGDEEPRYLLERRIILSPLMAKQLAVALATVLHERAAAQSGSLDATPAGRAGSAPAAADVPAGAEAMLALVERLKTGFGFEKSFKLSAGGVRADRLILGVKRDLADPQALMEICRRLGMPDAQLAQFAERLPEANTVGFGFEGGERGGAYKVYLEFWDRVRARVQRDPGNVSPALLFLGFKWAVADNTRSALATYTCHPLLSVRGIGERLERLYEGRADNPSLDAARDILALAVRRVPGYTFVYVEAAEEGNPRKSFDLNFYKAGLTVADLRPAFAALCARYSIAREKLERIEAQAGDRPFGHLSGGLGRDGSDFLTVYYELEGI